MTQPTMPTAAAPAAPAAPPTPEPTQTFTQEDVNRIVAERLARENKKYEGFDDFKAKAAEFDRIQAENATELDKAVKKAADEARADMSTKTNTRLVRAEVKAAASAARFHDPADAAVLLQSHFAGIKVTEDGDVDEAAVKALVEQLAKDKPHLVKSDSGTPRPLPGQGQNQPPPSTGREQGLAEARKRFGDKKPQT